MYHIVQRNPKSDGTTPNLPPSVVDRSPTYSLETFDNLASKQSQMLFRNPREAQYDLVIHFLKWFGVPELKVMRDKVLDYLRKSGLNAHVSLEPTDDGFGNPTDTVHLHIITDDDRGKDFLLNLGRTSCLAAGLQDKAICHATKNEFDVECHKLYDYGGYIDYVTKHNREEKVHLFIRGSRIRRFYTLNDWFIDATGSRRKRGDIWGSIKQEKQYKGFVKRLKKSERFIALQFLPIDNKRPTDYGKLKMVLDNEEDETLYDWYSTLVGKPTVFHTKPPGWLTRTLPSQSRKCNDLFIALEKRLLCTDSIEVMYAMVIYH